MQRWQHEVAHKLWLRQQRRSTHAAAHHAELSNSHSSSPDQACTATDDSVLSCAALQRSANDLPPVDPPERVAGYFKLNRTHDAHMFYFYFSSRSKNPNDPVILWMTGERQRRLDTFVFGAARPGCALSPCAPHLGPHLPAAAVVLTHNTAATVSCRWPWLLIRDCHLL